MTGLTARLAYPVTLNFAPKATSPFTFLALLVVLVCGFFISACGGGSSMTLPQPPPPPPSTGDFSLVIDVSSVTVQQGGAFQNQGIQANPTNGFNGMIAITISGLPSGVTTTPSGPFSLSASGSLQPNLGFQLGASPTASIGTATVTVTATSGTITHSVSFSLTVTQVAPFSIHVSPSSLTLSPGMSTTVRVSLTANAGTSPQLFVNVSGPPISAGINMSLPESLLTAQNPVSFFVNPTPLAQPLQNFPIVITAEDNPGSPMNSSLFILPLTVSIPFSSNTMPTRSTFARTDQSPTGMVYDQARKLVFVSVEILNEVIVLSSIDGHQVATIPVNFPAAVDEAADGSAVYVVSPFFSGVTIIDPNLLQVVRRVNLSTNFNGSNVPLAFFSVDALSNGKVLFFLSADFGIIPPIYLWDPVTGAFTNIAPPPSSQEPLASTSVVQRSADHSKVIISGSSFYLYDVASNTFSGPLPSPGGTLAISPDGTRIVSVAIQNSATVLLDDSANVLASLQLDAFPLVGVAYSLDGKHIYVFTSEPSGFGTIATVIDAQTFTIAGLVPGFSFGASLPFSGQVITTFAVDETNMLFGPAFRGVGFLDMSNPTFLAQPLPGAFIVQPQLASLSSTTQATLNGAGFSSDFGLNLFVGAPPASPNSLEAGNLTVQSANFVKLTVPKGTTAGPVNATLTRSDGFFEVIPDAVSFGPAVLQIDANAGSPSGDDPIRIVGFGFDDPATQVTIGGRAATITQTIGAIADTTPPTESISLTTPAGSSGKADVTIVTPAGSTTIPGGFHYLNSVQVYPMTGALDAIIYDRPRQRLYVSNQDHNRVEIFDLGSKQFLPPVSVGNSPTSLALTPDGALLAVVNQADGTVSVVDPVKMQVTATYPGLTAADNQTACGGVILQVSPAVPHRMVVSVVCAALLEGGNAHLMDLDSGSLSCTGVISCGSNGVDLGPAMAAATLASTPDGTQVFFTANDVGILNLSVNTLVSNSADLFFDAAASGDGSRFAAAFGTYDSNANLASIMAFEPYADSGAQSFHNVIGEKLDAFGGLLYFPQDSGVDIFDVHTGRLLRHVALPDPLVLDTNALALDETGTQMFLTSSSGITISQLDEVPLVIASVNPVSGSPGTTVTLHGSGFQDGTTVMFGGTQVSTTFVSANALTATVPSLPPGPVRVSVASPNSGRYGLDDLFTVE